MQRIKQTVQQPPTRKKITMANNPQENKAEKKVPKEKKEKKQKKIAEQPEIKEQTKAKKAKKSEKKKVKQQKISEEINEKQADSVA